MFRFLFRPKSAEPRPVDPRQWAEAFKRTRGDELPAPGTMKQQHERRDRDKAFEVGS